MIKKFLLVLICFMSMPAFTCSRALPTNDPGFCASFKSVAICHCTSSGLPAGLCQDVNAIYQRMLAVYGSLQKACEYQKFTTPQDCIDNWNCYRLGGVDSSGRLCSSNMSACQ